MSSLKILVLVIIGILLVLSTHNSNGQNILKIPKRGEPKVRVIKSSTEPRTESEKMVEKETKPFQEKYQLTILYEALCPDSERFMAQLRPVYEGLKNYLQLEFVPFGLTKLVCKNIINGKCEYPVFTCKHGPIGCRANRLHDCAFQYSDSQEKQLNFVMCTMGVFKATAEKCLNLLGYALHDVDICMTFDEGTELQLKSYNKTIPYKPEKLPVILLNNKFSEQNQAAAIKDFRIFLCTLFYEYGVFNEKNAPMICRTDDVFPNLQK